MRVSKLIGVLFLVAGVFIATRGVSWHVAYILLGLFFGFVGLLLVSRRRVRSFKVKAGTRRRSAPLAGRAALRLPSSRPV